MQKALRETAKYLEADRPDEAAAVLKDLLTEFPSNPDALRLAGFVACRRGRYEDGIEFLEKSITSVPDDPKSHCYLGSAYLRIGRNVDAENAFRRSLALSNANAEASYGLGEALRIRADFAAAEEAYRRTLEVAPDHWAAAAELANLYERANRLDEARSLLANALTRAPEYPLLNLVAAKFERREGRRRDAIDRLVALLRRNPAAGAFRRIHFELGRLYDENGDYEQAFEAFRAGNKLAEGQWRAANAGPNEALRDAEALLSAFTPEWVSTWRPAEPGLPDAPVFLLGFPRSGTTLLDQILDAHSGIQVLEEQATIGVVENRLASMKDGYPTGLAPLSAGRISELADLYYRCLDKHLSHRGSTRVVDKLPLNMTRAGLIHRVFPKAKIIFAVRHPCDVVLSCFMQNFGLNPAMANFFTLETTVRFYDTLMRLWQRYVELFALDVHTVPYEAVIEDIGQQAARLTGFLGVEWEPGMVNFHEHARRRGWISTPSYHQVSQPVYRHAVNRWEHYRDYLRPFFDILRPHAQRYDYVL